MNHSPFGKSKVWKAYRNWAQVRKKAIVKRGHSFPWKSNRDNDILYSKINDLQKIDGVWYQDLIHVLHRAIILKERRKNGMIFKRLYIGR